MIPIGQVAVFRHISDANDPYNGKLAVVTATPIMEDGFYIVIFDSGERGMAFGPELTPVTVVPGRGASKTPIYDQLARERRFSLDFVLVAG